MSDELQVAVVADPLVVAVPQPDIDVVVTDVSTPVVITSPEMQVVTVDDEDHIVDQVNEIQIVTVGEVGPAGADGADGGVVETYIAATSLGGHRVVVTNGSGELIYADVANAAHANQAVRISTQAAVAGASITIQASGRITEASWNWTPGATLYVGVNALPTETVPVAPAVFSKPIAVAETATRILMIHEPPVMLA